MSQRLRERICFAWMVLQRTILSSQGLERERREIEAAGYEIEERRRPVDAVA